MRTNFILLLLVLFSLNYLHKTALDSLPRKLRIKKDYLTPSKAAFYSAVLPGLGQIHTRRYWIVPFIYGGLATASYFYTDQNREMKLPFGLQQRIPETINDFTRKIALNSQLIEG